MTEEEELRRWAEGWGVPPTRDEALRRAVLRALDELVQRREADPIWHTCPPTWFNVPHDRRILVEVETVDGQRFCPRRWAEAHADQQAREEDHAPTPRRVHMVWPWNLREPGECVNSLCSRYVRQYNTDPAEVTCPACLRRYAESGAR